MCTLNIKDELCYGKENCFLIGNKTLFSFTNTIIPQVEG